METTTITVIRIENSQGVIDTLHWEAQENFDEIRKYGPIKLIETTADDIIKLNLSTKSKILLSAIAGAAWQRIVDTKGVNVVGKDPYSTIIRIV